MSIAIYCDERVFKGPVAEGGGMSEKGLKRLRVRRFWGEASTILGNFA